MEKTYYERMTSAIIGDDTRQLLGMYGKLHDLIGEYADFYERVFKIEMPDNAYDELCSAFEPAVKFWPKPYFRCMKNQGKC